jgi:hypothetical protein
MSTIYIYIYIERERERESDKMPYILCSFLTFILLQKILLLRLSNQTNKQTNKTNFVV